MLCMLSEPLRPPAGAARQLEDGLERTDAIERLEDPAAQFAFNLMTGAVRADALSRIELAERCSVDAQPRHAQKGDHAAVELHLPDVECGDAAVLARGDLVLSSQFQNLLAHLLEALLWNGGLAVKTRRDGIVRHQTGLLLA